MNKKGRAKKSVSRASTALAEFERQARKLTPAEWRRSIKQLAQDIAAQAPSQSLTHAECEEALPWYVSDEQRGEDVRTLYPNVWRHLQACQICGESYRFLSEAPAESPGASGEKTTQSSLPFLQPLPHDAWFQERESQLLGGKPRTTFLFNPTHIKNLCSRASASMASAIVSRDASDNTTGLLLNDQIVLDDQSFDVQAWLVSSPQSPDRFYVHLLIQSPEPLKTGLRARLKWGAEEYVTYLASGERVFEDISAPPLDKPCPDIPTSEFHLVLEAAPDEGHRMD